LESNHIKCHQIIVKKFIVYRRKKRLN